MSQTKFRALMILGGIVLAPGILFVVWLALALIATAVSPIFPAALYVTSIPAFVFCWTFGCAN